MKRQGSRTHWGFACGLMLMACVCSASVALAQDEIPVLTALGNASRPQDPNQVQAPPNAIKPKNLDEFRLLWAVAGADAPEIGPVDNRLPVGGNVRMLYESQFGRSPRGLEYLVGRLDSGNGKWLNTYLEFLDAHLTSIRQYLTDKPIVSDEPTFAVIDWEAFDWSFHAENTFNGGVGSQPWRAAVREINRDGLDVEFLRFVRYETTATSWDELVQTGEDEALVRKSYTHFARDYILRTLNVCRMYSPPETLWGFYFYPNTTVNPNFDRGIEGAFRASHDELKWLWPAIDFLAPVLYVMPYMDSQGQYDPSFKQGSSELLERYYEVNLDEAVRVRDTYAPKHPIVPFMMFYYHESHPITEPYIQYYFLTADNVAAQMLYPRMYGADSVFLWGTVAQFYVDRGSHQPLPVVLDRLDQDWAPAFRAAEDIIRQQNSGEGGGGLEGGGGAQN